MKHKHGDTRLWQGPTGIRTTRQRGWRSTTRVWPRPTVNRRPPLKNSRRTMRDWRLGLHPLRRLIVLVSRGGRRFSANRRRPRHVGRDCAHAGGSPGPRTVLLGPREGVHGGRREEQSKGQCLQGATERLRRSRRGGWAFRSVGQPSAKSSRRSQGVRRQTQSSGWRGLVVPRTVRGLTHGRGVRDWLG